MVDGEADEGLEMLVVCFAAVPCEEEAKESSWLEGMCKYCLGRVGC